MKQCSAKHIDQQAPHTPFPVLACSVRSFGALVCSSWFFPHLHSQNLTSRCPFASKSACAHNRPLRSTLPLHTHTLAHDRSSINRELVSRRTHTCDVCALYTPRRQCANHASSVRLTVGCAPVHVFCSSVLVALHRSLLHALRNEQTVSDLQRAHLQRAHLQRDCWQNLTSVIVYVCMHLCAFVCRWCKCSVCASNSNPRGLKCALRTVQLHQAQDVERATAAIAAATAATAAAASATASAAAALSSELHRSSKRQRVDSDQELDDDGAAFGGGGDDSFAMSELHEHAISSPTRTPPRSPQDSSG